MECFLPTPKHLLLHTSTKSRHTNTHTLISKHKPMQHILPQTQTQVHSHTHTAFSQMAEYTHKCMHTHTHTPTIWTGMHTCSNDTRAWEREAKHMQTGAKHAIWFISCLIALGSPKLEHCCDTLVTHGRMYVHVWIHSQTRMLIDYCWIACYADSSGV